MSRFVNANLQHLHKHNFNFEYSKRNDRPKILKSDKLKTFLKNPTQSSEKLLL